MTIQYWVLIMALLAAAAVQGLLILHINALVLCRDRGGLAGAHIMWNNLGFCVSIKVMDGKAGGFALRGRLAIIQIQAINNSANWLCAMLLE